MIKILDSKKNNFSSLLDNLLLKRKNKIKFNSSIVTNIIKDIKKTLRQTEKELDRPNYALIKYSWVKDSVWIYWKEKAFSVTKGDIKYLNSKL